MYVLLVFGQEDLNTGLAFLGESKLRVIYYVHVHVVLYSND